MLLLHHLHQLNHRLIVAHVNYKMRDESDGEMWMVINEAKKLQCDVVVKDFNEVVKGNFQDQARRFRYAFFKDLKDKYQAKGVCVGHHLDDDLETYLMQEGSNRKATYPGLNVHSEVMGIHVYRPLLHLSKDEIVQLCHEQKIPYAIDKSNLETIYTRNKIRYALVNNELINFGYNNKDALIHELMKKKRERDVFLKTLEQDLIRENPFNINLYTKLPSDKRIWILRDWLEYVGVNPYEMREAYLNHLDSLILMGDAKEPMGHKVLSVSYGEVCVFEPESFVYEFDKIWYHKTGHFELKREGKTMEGLTLSADDFPIKVRSVQSGDKIKMRFGTKAVNRFFIDRKIPYHKRHNWLVVENCVRDVVFVAEMGCDVCHYSNNPNVFVVNL